MRIKLESRPSLPVVKAWFTTGNTGTISELKRRLCTDLPAFQDAELEASDILLELDEFELLEGSAMDVLRDGDLIIIKRSTSVLQQTSKRKAASDTHTEPVHKRAKHVANAQPAQASTSPSKPVANGTSKRKRSPSPSSSSETSSSSDASDSSDSSSDTDSSSTSTSDPDSESASDSSSSSSSAPAPPKRAATTAPSQSDRLQATANPKAQSEAPHVPPGYGKPTTHSRNLRRRRKRMFERLSSTAEPASVNAIPLGDRPPTAPAVPDDAPAHMADVPAQREQQPQFMMANLQNKNKRKGFKDALQHGVPPKIVFAEPAPALQGMPFAQQADEEIREETVVRPRRFARLIPPSEKQEAGVLPANMFVTSVDVEEGLWNGRKRKGKKKAQAQMERDERVVEEEVELQYGEAAAEEVVENKASEGTQGVGRVDAKDVEKRWATLPKLTKAEQVKEGSMVAWKALGINPATFTPELLSHHGRVHSIDNAQLIVELLSGVGVQLAFGGMPVDEEDEEETVLETVGWADVSVGDWRIVG